MTSVRPSGLATSTVLRRSPVISDTETLGRRSGRRWTRDRLRRSGSRTDTPAGDLSTVTFTVNGGRGGGVRPNRHLIRAGLWRVGHNP